MAYGSSPPWKLSLAFKALVVTQNSYAACFDFNMTEPLLCFKEVRELIQV